MNWLVIMLILTPFAGGLLVIFPGRFLKVLRWVFSLLVVLVCGVLLGIAFKRPGTTNIAFSVWRLIGSTTSHQFSASPLAYVLAAVFVLLWLFVFLYSFGFLKKGEAGEASDTEFYALALFMLGSALGLLFSRDLVFIYLFWEIAAVATWRLVGYERNQKAIKVATRTIIINFLGSALMLVGFIILSLRFSTFNLAAMNPAQLADSSHLLLAGIFILAGIFAKSAVLPLYIWVPAAYAASPPPVIALLAGAIENFGLIVYMKIFVDTLSPLTSNPAWQITMLGIALASCLVAGGAALVAKDYRKILGYSTVSQLAFILAGFAVLSIWGITGAILFIVAHGLGKATLLLGYGAVEQKVGDREIMGIGRLARRFPVLFTGIIIATLSVIGLPPLLGFFAKIDVLYGVLVIPSGAVVLGGGFILASIFTLLYMLRLFSSVFLRGNKIEEDSKMREPMYLSVLVLILSLALIGSGIAVKPLMLYLGTGG